MSRPSDSELAALGEIADELREVFAERGHNVAKALNVDPDFGSGQSKAWLARDLAIGAVSRAASRVGIDFRPVNGIGRELRCISGSVDRRYRFLHAQRRGDELVVMTNSESALSAEPGGQQSLLSEEPWVFAWTYNADMQIVETVVAEVRGVVPGKPGHLVLGMTFALGGGGLTPTDGFIPSDEGLDGFGEEEEGETGTSGLF